MAKKDIDWANIGFGYIQTEKDMLLILKMVNGIKEVL